MMFHSLTLFLLLRIFKAGFGENLIFCSGESDSDSSRLSCSTGLIHIQQASIQEHSSCQGTGGSCEITDAEDRIRGVCDDKQTCTITAILSSNDVDFNCVQVAQVSIEYSCDQDGTWNTWTNWTSCEKTCGYEKRNRTRECVEPLGGGAPCNGLNVEEELCDHPYCEGCDVDTKDQTSENVEECIADEKLCLSHDGTLCYKRHFNGSVAEWTEWTTCVEGEQVRIRDCQQGFGPNADCAGEELTQVKACQNEEQKPKSNPPSQSIFVKRKSDENMTSSKLIARDVTQITCVLKCKVIGWCRKAGWRAAKDGGMLGICFGFDGVDAPDESLKVFQNVIVFDNPTCAP
ncbi:A disintegrin and metalloproteinase with thrombospondin motifs adt-1-like [Clytia hemisphaerica]|uniref:Uncharacterized protein n=1 Tax=Clytia hemisphaerica TaxID=252671 RepID=A0A7M5X1K5_9CNID